MGPVYKIVLPHKNQDLIIRQYGKIPTRTIVNAPKSVAEVEEGEILHDISFNTPITPVVTKNTRKGKRNKETNIEKKKAKKLKTGNMIHSQVKMVNEDSNTSAYAEEDDSISSDSDFIRRNSISSDHDYLSEYLCKNDLEPIKFDIIKHFTNDKYYLEIMEQPAEMFRFRYQSEMNGMHGSILGRSTNSEKARKKTYPSVKLNNYPKTAIILCTLLQNDVRRLRFHPHHLSLRGENDQTNITDPITRTVYPGHNTVTYQGVAVVHTARKKAGEELYRKRKRLYQLVNESLTKEQECDLKISSEKTVEHTNMNTVRFLFVAYDAETKVQICNPIYSEPVMNLKCAETGTLKISRMSRYSGSVRGGDEIFMFVEKVSKKNIRVRFFELEGNKRVWEDYATFSENDVHHQYGIVLRTPPYKDLDITSSKKVYVELFRPKDESVSPPNHFEYQPSTRCLKRRRLTENSGASMSLASLESNSSSEYNKEIPAVVSLADKHTKPYMILSNDPNSIIKGSLNFGSLDGISPKDLIDPLQSEEWRTLYNNFDTRVKFDPMLSASSQIVVDGIQSSTQEPENAEATEEYDSDNFSKEDKFECSKTIQEIQRILKSKSSEANESALKIIDRCFSNNNCLQHYLVAKNQLQALDQYLEMVQKFKLEYCLDFGNIKGETALHTAVLCEQSDAVAKLLLAGCDPNILNKDGDSPLHLCAKEDNKECMVQLLSKNNYKPGAKNLIDVNIPNAEGWTALHLAVVQKSLASVSRLLRANANPNVKGQSNGRTPLHLAVAESHTVVVNYLLKCYNIEVDAQDDDGETPLHLASTLDTAIICEKLLEAGADPTKLYKGMSAITIATKRNNLDILKVFHNKFPTLVTDPTRIKDEPSEETPLDNEGEIQIKEEPRDCSLMDSKTSMIVTNSLKNSGLWKDLAINLGFSNFVAAQLSLNLTNPINTLLNLIEIQDKEALKKLQRELEKLNLMDAADAVKDIITE